MHFTVPRWFERDGFWRAPDAADLFARYTEAALPVVQRRRPLRLHDQRAEHRRDARRRRGRRRTSSPTACRTRTCRSPTPCWPATSGRARSWRQVSGLQSGWTIATQAFQADRRARRRRDAPRVRLPARRLVPASSRAGRRLRRRAGLHAHVHRPRRAAARRRRRRDDADRLGVLARGRRRAASAARGSCPATCRSWSPRTASRPPTTPAASPTRRARSRASTAASRTASRSCGYQHWSLLDNYEWASGFRPTFGLVAWDRETFERTPKPSAHWYGGVARANALTV